jgi:hypothetical protein
MRAPLGRSIAAYEWPPPRDWQVFEDLCCDLMSRLWNDPYTQKNGRSGQVQRGVDIFGQPNQEAEWAGAQCKLKSPRAGSRLSFEEVKREVEKARRFEPPLKRLVVATSALRDARLQERVRAIDERERRNGSFSVTILFWEDILAKLWDFPDLAQKYYQSAFLPHTRHDAKEPGATAGRLTGLQVELTLDEDLDFAGMVPAFSSEERETSDLSLLMAGLSNIGIVNHDDRPTEILRLWLDLDGHLGPAPEIKEEVLTGSRRVEARSRRRFALTFAALFQGPRPEDWQRRLVLRVQATGFEELRILLRLETSPAETA